MVVVTSASESDQAGARQLFARASKQISERLTRLVCIWVDAGYQGEGFMKWVMDTYRWILEVVGITVPEKEKCTLRRCHSHDLSELLRGCGSGNTL